MLVGFIKNFASSFFTIVNSPSTKGIAAVLCKTFDAAKVDSSAINIERLVIDSKLEFIITVFFSSTLEGFIAAPWVIIKAIILFLWAKAKQGLLKSCKIYQWVI